VFRYYVRAFAAYLLAEAARGDSAAASTFLGLLVDREKRDAGSVVEVYRHLTEAVEFVAAHQEFFEAEPAIYGSFQERADAVVALCTEKPRR
jgi:hypothetical protein